MIYKENTEQKNGCTDQKMWDLYKTNIFLRSVHRMVFLEDAAKNRHFQNLNRRANARKKTRENDILVTGCIYK